MNFSTLKPITLIIIAFFATGILSGCVLLELGMEAEASIGAAEVASAESILGAEGAAVLERSLIAGEGGTLTIASTEGINTLLEKVTVRETAGGVPRLFSEGKSAPFGEVYTKSGRIRLLEGSGRFISINEDIFSVRDGQVNVMMSPKSFSRVVGHVRQGQMIVKLAEENGWYQIRLVENAQVSIGWVDALAMMPVLLASDHGRWSYFGKNGPYASGSKKRNYSVFVNPVPPGNELAILMIDQDGNSLSVLANAVADKYRKDGRSSTLGLVNPSIGNIPEFNDFFNGTQNIYQKMNLSKYVKYMLIGKVNYAYRKGVEAEGTIICNATMTLHVISTSTGSLYRSLPIPAAIGNGVTEEQAQDQANQRLYNRFVENSNF